MADESHDVEIRNLLCALPVPDSLYACWGAGCRQEQTWPAEDLAWFSGREKGTDGDGLNVEAVEAGWYCPQCREHLEIECDGPPLSAVLAARSGRGEPMSEDGALIHALNMAGDEPAPHAPRSTRSHARYWRTWPAASGCRPTIPTSRSKGTPPRSRERRSHGARSRIRSHCGR